MRSGAHCDRLPAAMSSGVLPCLSGTLTLLLLDKNSAMSDGAVLLLNWAAK